jgi:hypothetical protein
MLEDLFSTVESLSDAQTVRFYESLIVNLTVVNRGILYEDDYSESDKLILVKIVNEMLHRVGNGVVDLRYEHGIWSDQGMMLTLSAIISVHMDLLPKVRSAIRFSLNTAASIK